MINKDFQLVPHCKRKSLIKNKVLSHGIYYRLKMSNCAVDGDTASLDIPGSIKRYDWSALTGDLLVPAVWQLLWWLFLKAGNCYKCELRLLCATVAVESLLAFLCICNSDLECSCFLLGCFSPKFYCKITPLTLKLLALPLFKEHWC